MRNEISKTMLVAVLMSSLALATQAADVLRVDPVAGQAYQLIDSSLGYALNTVTNGFYPKSIGVGATTKNLVKVLGTSGNSLAMELSGTAYSTNGGGTYTAVFTLYCSTRPPAITTGGTNGIGSSPYPLQVFDTITLPLSATVGTYATTNKVYTTSTTPAKGALPYIYVGTIAANGAILTNYSVWANNY